MSNSGIETITSERAIQLLEERKYTSAELGGLTGLHPATIRKIFADEPGVIRIGHATGGMGKGGRKRRQYYTLRIPATVAARVLARLSNSGGSA